ncbi:hypothetical protein Hypma_000072 [Hypsizygus marmoreus]|uniref:Uncharacterized protein n=1 Tax=Hypsizygus marmoreus TaxID=39966 RepID=A0A369KDW6_HYPMA|nr:hypothetical protein Hypma_000072 [Hypsizygus marmoreus]
MLHSMQNNLLQTARWSIKELDTIHRSISCGVHPKTFGLLSRTTTLDLRKPKTDKIMQQFYFRLLDPMLTDVHEFLEISIHTWLYWLPTSERIPPPPLSIITSSILTHDVSHQMLTRSPLPFNYQITSIKYPTRVARLHPTMRRCPTSHPIAADNYTVWSLDVKTVKTATYDYWHNSDATCIHHARGHLHRDMYRTFMKFFPEGSP